MGHWKLGKSWNFRSLCHKMSGKMMLSKRYKINLGFFVKKKNGKNIPKMKMVSEKMVTLVMENLKTSWKRSWKVMEFQKLKRV